MYRSRTIAIVSWVATLLMIAPRLHCQDNQSTTAIGEVDSEMSPQQQLRTFYASRQGLIVFLQSPRVSGRGWKIEKEARKQLQNEVDRCLEKRKPHIAEAEKLATTDGAFWKKVVDDEIESELKLATLMDEVLTPKEQSAYVTENAKELASTTFYSAAFWRMGKLSEEQQQQIVNKVKRQMLLRAEVLRKKPSEYSAPPLVNLLEGLTLKQLEVLFKLQARMDEDMTIGDYLEIASPQEKEFLARYNFEVRKYLEEKGGEPKE